MGHKAEHDVIAPGKDARKPEADQNDGQGLVQPFLLHNIVSYDPSYGAVSDLQTIFIPMQVRSCTLDTWLPDQVAFMAQTGNHRANEFYEARLEPSAKPIYASGDIASFIRRKV